MQATQVNNAFYETAGGDWWDDDAGFEFTSLRYCMNPVRLGYFRSVLGRLGCRCGAVLDIGCGGGYLSESFASEGYKVAGIDPAGRSIEAAREHAAASGLSIDYRVGRGEELPFEDASFDIAACCDVLEHVDDVGGVLSEVSRTLKPGGILLFDTVNRTRKSWFVLIKIWQDWGLVASRREKNLHVWEKFIRPNELDSALRQVGVVPEEMTGITSRTSPLALLWALWRMRRGSARVDARSPALALRETNDLSVSYMGYARKAVRVGD